MFEKYATYTVEDFIKDENFIEWSRHSHTGEESLWQAVVSDYPYQAEVIVQAKHMLLQLQKASVTPVSRLDVDEIWSGIEEAIAVEGGRFNVFVHLRRFRFLAVASVLLAVSLVWWKYGTTHKEPLSVYAELIKEAEVPLQEVANSSGQSMNVDLPDGSKVTLDPRSRLSYSKDFKNGKTRDVFLSGAAFFDVTRNTVKPFIVYANEVTTKVLGTSFRIEAFEADKKVIVSVKTGKVSVFANKRKSNSGVVKGITLIPNQQAIFSRAEEILSRSLVEQPGLVISKDELVQFTFANAPVSSIFEAVEKAYGVEIVFDKELLSGCRLTTSLNNETLFERLDIICEAIEATYKVVDGQVLISGQRCN